MFTRIVVGWDDAPSSAAALEWAARHADGRPIRIIHALSGGVTGSDYLRATGELAAERVRLMDVARDLTAAHPDLHLSTATEHGLALDVLLLEMEPETLVVVGAADARRKSRWTIGARLAGRHMGGGVAVIPPGEANGAGIVVGVDGSASSFDAMDAAIDLARRFGDALEVVHAWTVPYDWETAYGEFADDIVELEAMHRGILDSALEYVDDRGFEAVGRLELGRPAEVLRSVGGDAALVVVASHGGRALARFFIGSVSRELAEAPNTPLLVVNPAR